jgi:hypothetical protein
MKADQAFTTLSVILSLSLFLALALGTAVPARACECHPGVNGRITCYPVGCEDDDTPNPPDRHRPGYNSFEEWFKDTILGPGWRQEERRQQAEQADRRRNEIVEQRVTERLLRGNEAFDRGDFDEAIGNTKAASKQSPILKKMEFLQGTILASESFTNDLNGTWTELGRRRLGWR